MKEIICYTSYLPEGAKQNISFMELLLDERWAEGIVLCPEGVFQEVGNINDKLTANQDYEFLLRAVQKYTFTVLGSSSMETILASPAPEGFLFLNSQKPPVTPQDRYRTDCYIAGKYQKELLSSGYFNSVMEALLADASRLPDSEEAIAWLEKMVSHKPEYFSIDDYTRPILIYRSSDTCYNTLNLFADQLAEALRSCRQRVAVFDVEKEGNQALTQFIGRRFKAIIGIQTYIFSIMMQDKKTNLHDLIHGPKYNLILDHPAWMKEHIENGPEDYYLLLHDRNYLAFARQYYPHVKGCIYFSPGGIAPAGQQAFGKRPSGKQSLYAAAVPSADNPGTAAASFPFSRMQKKEWEKPYDITFIGSYYDYRDRLAAIASYDRPRRFLAARFLHIMHKDPDCPAEQAFWRALEYYHRSPGDTEFLSLFFELRQACFCIMHYYREKIIRTLLDAGIQVHVYSASWQQAPFAGHEKLICHPALSAEESLKVMGQSKISLNIMSWHKDGLTERVLNAMLCQSVVLSDRSTGLENAFVNGQDLLLFSLRQIPQLPALVKELLADDTRLQKIAHNGFQKAMENHQWQHRAKQFLEILQPPAPSAPP